MFGTTKEERPKEVLRRRITSHYLYSGDTLAADEYIISGQVEPNGRVRMVTWSWIWVHADSQPCVTRERG